MAEELDNPTGTGDEETAGSEPSSDVLRTELELLAEENERLRRAFSRTRHTSTRRTALGLAVLGLVGIVAGIVMPDSRRVLFVLGGIGVFAAILTVYVTPEQFVAADVGRSTYAALAANHAALADELGLAETTRYVPLDGGNRVRLYVPQVGREEIPDEDELRSTTVVTERSRGLALRPTGGALLDAADVTLPDSSRQTPEQLATELCEALVERFELARSVRPDVDPEAGRLTVGVTDSAYGSVARFDHPVSSLLATGLARGLETPVELDVEPVSEERADALVTCRWPAGDGQGE